MKPHRPIGELKDGEVLPYGRRHKPPKHVMKLWKSARDKIVKKNNRALAKKN